MSRTQIYDVLGFKFFTRELAIQSIKLSYGRIAQVVPNALLTQATVIFNDRRRKNLVLKINIDTIHNLPTHL